MTYPGAHRELQLSTAARFDAGRSSPKGRSSPTLVDRRARFSDDDFRSLPANAGALPAIKP